MSSLLDFSNIPICGRERELEILQDAADAKKAAVVFVSASPGTGKTTLVNAFRRAKQQQRNRNDVFICQGAYSENDVEPFALMKSCFWDIMEQWRPEDGKKLRKMVNESTLSELEPLRWIMPQLWERIFFIPEDFSSSASSEANEASQNDIRILSSANHPSVPSSGLALERLGLAIRSLLRLLTHIRQLILLLDDLQWASGRAKHMFIGQFNDPQLQNNLTVIACHRDDEVSQRTVDEIKQHVPSHRLINLPLMNLTIESITDIIAKLSRREKDEGEVTELSKIVHERTHGNAFFVIQLLSQIVRKGGITEQLGTQRWQIDIDRILAETQVTDNVVDLVVEKITGLEDQVQETLSTAACLGIQSLDANIIAGAMHGCLCDDDSKGKDASRDIDESLSKLCGEGLLLHVRGKRVYKFAHHRVLSAASSLLPVDKSRMHERFGKNLRVHGESNLGDFESNFSVEQVLMLSMDHLSRCSFIFDDKEEVLDLARFGVKVADIARKQFAFQTASVFLQTSREWLLRGNGWNQNYDLLLKSTIDLSQTSYSLGDLNQSRAMAEEAIRHSKSLQDHLPVLKTLAFTLLQTDNGMEGFELCAVAVRSLGVVDFPSNMVFLKSVLKTLKLMKKCNKQPDSFFTAQRQCKDERVRHAYDLLEVLNYIALSVKRNDLMFAGTASMSWLLYSHGRILGEGELPNLLAFFALALGKQKEAYRYVQLTRKLLPEIGHSRDRAVMWLVNRAYIDHWYNPLQEALSPLVGAHRALLESGDSSMLGTCMSVYSLIYFQSGLYLSFVEADGMRTKEIMDALGLNYSKRLFLPILQMILNLRGDSADPLVLRGRVMDYQKFLGDGVDDKSKDHGVHLYHFALLMLSIVFGKVESALRAAKHMLSKEDEGPLAWTPLRVFLDTLTHFMAAKKSSGIKRQIHIKTGKTHLRWLEAQRKQGNPNCHHYILLCRAELLSLKSKDVERVRAAYDDAIRTSARIGVLYCKGLASESAARYFHSKGDTYWFEVYLQKAFQDYLDWGAISKVDQLLERFPNVLGKEASRLGLTSASEEPSALHDGVPSHISKASIGVPSTSSVSISSSWGRAGSDSGGHHSSTFDQSLGGSSAMGLVSNTTARTAGGVNAKSQFHDSAILREKTCSLRGDVSTVGSVKS